MKYFIVKSTLYFIISLFVLFGILCMMGLLKKNNKILFTSNSISFNAKAAFLLNNKTEIDKAKIIIMGSSMSLNNINGEFIQSLLGEPVVNISSWGIKLEDLNCFKNYFGPKTVIIMNISFNDFGKSDFIKYSDFPLNRNVELNNKIFHFYAYLDNIRKIDKYTGESAMQNYTNLNFDKTGSVKLISNNFNISQRRWEDSPKIPSEYELDKFVHDLNFIKQYKVYIFFSPERLKYKSLIKIKAVELLKLKINGEYKNVSFFNNYAVNYSDTLFCDCTHFNDKGDNMYTQLIFSQINSFKLIHTH